METNFRRILLSDFVYHTYLTNWVVHMHGGKSSISGQQGACAVLLRAVFIVAAGNKYDEAHDVSISIWCRFAMHELIALFSTTSIPERRGTTSPFPSHWRCTCLLAWTTTVTVHVCPLSVLGRITTCFILLICMSPGNKSTELGEWRAHD
ncbi:hypothetical protein HDV57DRAFT_71463 [Trichoderma longibrachiatum]|uniref:Uncharacterized protein n=1 Tax=Trichoderma longibrachiatum ATCC 18648 TaxID=983965 RepID=A0A2T4BUS5_TRILO|nr:hypothetical protein M440DRAFT_138664 [Trichoderma longibrachiatum ATCC 18648]